MTEMKECQDNTTLRFCQTHSPTLKLDGKIMQGTLGCLKVPSVKLSFRHVHDDWQMVLKYNQSNRSFFQHSYISQNNNRV